MPQESMVKSDQIGYMCHGAAVQGMMALQVEGQGGGSSQHADLAVPAQDSVCQGHAKSCVYSWTAMTNVHSNANVQFCASQRPDLWQSISRCRCKQKNGCGKIEAGEQTLAEVLGSE